MKATFRFRDPGELEATIAMTMRMDDWRRIALALQEQKDSHYGPVGVIHAAVQHLIKDAEKTFVSQPEESA